MSRGHRYAGTLDPRDGARHLKLAQILPQATLPATRAPGSPGSSGSRVSSGSFGDDGALARLGATLQRTGVDLATAQARIQRAEDAKRKQLATQEADAAEAALDTALATTDSDLRVTERDPDRYEQTLTQLVQERARETLTGMRTEEGKALLSARLPKILGQASISARKHSNGLFVERSTGLLDQTTADLVTKAGLTPVGEEEAFDDLIARGTRAIDNAVPILGEKVAGERRRAFVDAVVTERARRHRDLDPEHFAEVADQKYPQMDPKRRDEFKTAASASVRQAQKDAAAAMEKFFTRVENEAEEERQAAVTNLYAQARDGAMTLGQLEDQRRMGRFRGPGGDTDYNALRDAIERPKTLPSDPSAASRVLLDVESLHPQTTEREIDDLHERYRKGVPGGLSLADAIKAKGQLRTTRNTLRTQGESTLTREHNQAEQELRTMFGFRPGMMELITGKLEGDRTAMLYGGFLSQLRARSSLFGGREAPLAVIEEMRGRITAVVGEQVKFREQEIRSQLLYPDRASLDQAKAQGRIQGALYDQQRRLMMDLETLPPSKTTTDQTGAKRK